VTVGEVTRDRGQDAPARSVARRRRYVLAPDSFKGTIAAEAACAALAEGIRRVDPEAEVVLRPMADGGEGTVAAIRTVFPGARSMPVRVTGPHDEPVDAEWLFVPATGAGAPTLGVVELANTSGIELLAGRNLRPLDAHTRGFGEAIASALAHGVDRLVLCIGSSASSDGGAGALSALGARLLDAQGREVPHGVAGIERVVTVDTAGLIGPPGGGAVVITDVRSPLTGPLGAAHVFAPQKGADAGQVERIDAALARWAQVRGGDPEVPGAGAAGGTGFGLLSWGAEVTPGAEAVAGLLGLAELVTAADVLVTGEGSYDAQSLDAKVPALILRLARRAGCWAAIVAGRIEAASDPFDARVSLTEMAGSSAAALADPARWLRDAGAIVAAGLVRTG